MDPAVCFSGNSLDRFSHGKISGVDRPIGPAGGAFGPRASPRLRALHHRRGLLVLLPRLPIRSWSHFSCSGDAQLTEGGPPWKGHSLKAPLGNPPFLQLPLPPEEGALVVHQAGDLTLKQFLSFRDDKNVPLPRYWVD